MKYYGIKKPKIDGNESYIWWISDSEHNSWYSFFTYPNKEGSTTYSRAPMSEAIKAYKLIGYKCIELDIKEKI